MRPSSCLNVSERFVFVFLFFLLLFGFLIHLIKYPWRKAEFIQLAYREQYDQNIRLVLKRHCFGLQSHKTVRGFGFEKSTQTWNVMCHNKTTKLWRPGTQHVAVFRDFHFSVLLFLNDGLYTHDRLSVSRKPGFCFCCCCCYCCRRRQQVTLSGKVQKRRNLYVR